MSPGASPPALATSRSGDEDPLGWVLVVLVVPLPCLPRGVPGSAVRSAGHSLHAGLGPWSCWAPSRGCCPLPGGSDTPQGHPAPHSTYPCLCRGVQHGGEPLPAWGRERRAVAHAAAPLLQQGTVPCCPPVCVGLSARGATRLVLTCTHVGHRVLSSARGVPRGSPVPGAVVPGPPALSLL